MYGKIESCQSNCVKSRRLQWAHRFVNVESVALIASEVLSGLSFEANPEMCRIQIKAGREGFKVKNHTRH